MRPGQNKRMRGRNNNGGGSGNGGNRKGPNPLTRSYESNGPDVKIRGTAHHVGEKYLQLARDAQSSGDPVMAESYLQHAEHYFRLIAAAQQAQQQAAYGYQRPAGEQSEPEDDDGDDDFSSLPDRFASPAERVVTPPPQPAPQPYPERQPYNGGERQSYEPRQDRERQDRPQGQEKQYGERHNNERQPQADRPQGDRAYGERQTQGEGRYERQERNRSDRQPYGERNVNRQDRPPYQERQDRPAPEVAAAPERNGQGRDYDNRGPRNGRRESRDPQPREYREPRQAEVEPVGNALPAFITAPVRVQPEPTPISEPATAATEVAPEALATEDAGFALRPRRRRRTKAEFAEANGGDPQGVPASDPVGE